MISLFISPSRVRGPLQRYVHLAASVVLIDQAIYDLRLVSQAAGPS